MGELLLYPEEEPILASRPGAYPFVSPYELVWTTMEGERQYGFVPFDWDSGLLKFQSKDEEGIVCGGGAGGYTMSYLKELSAGYVLRALGLGTRFFRGSGLWGCTEMNVLIGVYSLVKGWISDLKSIESLMEARVAGRAGSVPVFLRQYDKGGVSKWPTEALDKTRAVRLELEWAGNVFLSMINAINSYYDVKEYVPGVPSPASTINIYEAARTATAYASGIYDSSVLATFNRDGLDKTLPDRLVSFYQNAALKYAGKVAEDVIEDVRAWVVKTASSMGAREAIEGAISSLEGFLSSPVAGSFFDNMLTIIAGFANATKEHGPEHFYRGEDIIFSKKNVEWYMVMSWRAYQQAIHRAALLLSGNHPALEDVDDAWVPFINLEIGAEGKMPKAFVPLINLEIGAEGKMPKAPVPLIDKSADVITPPPVVITPPPVEEKTSNVVLWLGVAGTVALGIYLMRR